MPDNVSTLYEANAPILLLDTCSILDLLRIPFDNVKQSKQLTHALKVIEASNSNPPQNSIVFSSRIEQEILDNKEGIYKGIQTFQNQLDSFCTANEIFFNEKIQIPHTEQLLEKLNSLIGELSTFAIKLESKNHYCLETTA